MKQDVGVSWGICVKYMLGSMGFVKSALEVLRRVSVESTKCSDFNGSEEALSGTKDCRYLVFSINRSQFKRDFWHC